MDENMGYDVYFFSQGIAESGGVMANYEYDPEHTAVRAEIMEQGVDSLPRDSHVSENYSV